MQVEIGQTISHYHILEKLREGGMGVVYKALDTSLHRNVALKFIPTRLTSDESVRKRFLVEARAASSLDHPNICTIHEISEAEDGQLFICMAFYDGQPLNRRIKQAPLQVDDAMHLFLQIIGGLQAAHEKGIIHRDVKPANILITEKEEAKIVDFGLARLAIAYCDIGHTPKPTADAPHKAKAAALKALELDEKLAEVHLAHTYALAGMKEQAMEIVHKLEQRSEIWDTWCLAAVYAGLGNADKLFYWLEKAFEYRHPYIQWIRNSYFETYFSDPRFGNLSVRLDLPQNVSIE